MRRRDVIAGLFWAVGSAGETARSQPSARVRIIGVLMGIPAADPEARSRASALETTLRELGWRPGVDVDLRYRWAAGGARAMADAAKELVALPCDVVVARSTPAVRALTRESRTIPIVAAGIFDPVGNGFAQSLARPGGNVTGLTNYEPSLAGKWLELLRSLAPAATRAALLFNPEAASAFQGSFERLVTAAGPSLGIQVVAAPVRAEQEFPRVIDQAIEAGAGGLIVLPDIFMTSHRARVVQLAAERRLPAIYPNRTFVESGGLASYSIDTRDLTVRAAGYVDRILRGASAAELPIEQPTKYELVLNLQTAKALGVDIPPTLLARADEVIE